MLATRQEHAMFEENIDSDQKDMKMSIQKFDKTPTSTEAIDLNEITQENVKDAWKEYAAKPEYKDFNKHDMIESMQSSENKAE